MRALPGPVPAALNRRLVFSTVAGAAGAAASVALAGCGATSAPTSSLGATEPLPETVPPGTALTIAGPDQKLALQLAGKLEALPFTVPDWPNIGAGPDVINAFRARSLDVGRNAGIPPIQSHFQGGLDARIVAVNLVPKPIYVFATKPRSEIQTVADFRGKKLAFSQGQAQGVVLLRALKQAGIKYADVTLVPLTSNQFLTALQAGQVDVAPLGLTTVTQYLNQYGKDGARRVDTDVVDLLSILWAPGRVLADPAKVAAIAAFIPFWAQSLVWQFENPDTWIREYYVKDQGISEAQARDIVAASTKPVLPPKWDAAIAWEQETVELLAQGEFVKPFDANVLFDRRFEALAAGAVAETYRS